MRAVVWQGPKTVETVDVDDPVIEKPNDAIVEVSATCICGSDLHLFDHGGSLGMKPGDIVGHEAVGRVVETGPDTGSLSVGDRVVVPFNIACGHCALCRIGMHSQCETTQSMGGKRGAALFGYSHQYGGVPGAQAQYLRVPEAQFGPVIVHDDLPDEALVLLADVLPTAWQAVAYADLPDGGSLVIHGLGPIGQMCARIARYRGAGQITGIDPEPSRRQQAQEEGVVTLDPDASDLGEAVRTLTQGRGADSVIDAVGMDATGSLVDRALQAAKLQPDRLVALKAALDTVRRGGTVSVIGVYGGWYPQFPLGDLFDRQITLRWGQANVRRWTDDILATVRDGDPLRTGDFVTHQAPLDDADRWYSAFRDKQHGVRKVLLRPWETVVPAGMSVTGATASDQYDDGVGGISR
jgi:threonine dehydrogenase-like Zn-dependent dehydrogenase